MHTRTWKTEMTKPETQRGIVFFLLFLFLFPRLNAWVQRMVMGEGEVLIAEANVIYYAILFLMVAFVFWGFLKKDFVGLLDWLPENLFGIVVGLLLAGGLRVLLSQLPFPVADPIFAQYVEQFLAAPVPTLALVLLLIPLVEEVLFRGLVYGHLRNYSRPLALVACTLFYALACVWRYALETGDTRYLLLTFLYLPTAAALNWCYENGGSVWGTTVLHGAINGLILMMSLHA